MRKLKFASVTICLILLLTRCSKGVNQPPQLRISTPELILGKWNIVNEEDTSFYSQHFQASSWNFKNWFYNFRENGILEVSNNDIVDSFTYYFSDEKCINIDWIGGTNNTYTDTVLMLTETDYVFKHWVDNQNNGKTKKVFHLSR